MPRASARSVRAVRLEGPFFTKDPRRVFLDNTGEALQEMATEQAREVARQIQVRAGSMPYYTGHSAAHVRGRVKSLAGKRWRLHAVVSMNVSGMGGPEAKRTQAAVAGRHNAGRHGTTPGIEGRWHPFRRVANASRRITRDLVKGLA